MGSISFGCCAGAHVYRNNADGTWTRSFGFLGGNSSLQFVFGDINGDGHADFAGSHGAGTVYLGDGAGGFTLAEANLPGSAWRSGVALGDIDGDGRDDLAYVAEENCAWFVGGTNELHVFRETSTPTSALVHPVRPRGGEVFIAGSVWFLDWRAAVPAGEGPRPPTVSIALSTTGPQGPFTPIASEVPNNGRYQWVVPADLGPSADCYLRYTLHTEPETVTVTTPSAFTILAPAATHVAEPDPEAGRAPAVAAISAVVPNPFNPILGQRLFVSKAGLAGRWSQYYWGEVETPALGVNRRHRLKRAV